MDTKGQGQLLVIGDSFWEENQGLYEEVAAFKMGQPPYRGKALSRRSPDLLGREVYIAGLEQALESGRRKSEEI